ncbi:MAG: PilZ domain-containing protein [Candidatus Magnetoovum sp. WYHC-5]|nr:PilZ domain-containing protein [Candidatus Magnetoovum sp. WYHC-5]
MSLEIGDTVFCKLLPKYEQYKTNIVSINGDTIVLRKDMEKEHHFFKGQNVVLFAGEVEYFADVVDEKDDTLILKCFGEERREYFRIDDVMPVIVNKIEGGDISPYRSRVITEYGHDMPNLVAYGVDVPDENISPRLWKMLVDINTKLSLLLDKVTLGNEGLIDTEYKKVSLSASGIRLKVIDKLSKSDFVEVKLLLPASPPVGLAVYGIVVWVKKYAENDYEVSIQFADIEESVREEIIQYTLKRQREIFRKERGLKH